MTEASHGGSRKAVLGTLGAVAAAVLVMVLPAPEGLSPEGQRLAAIFVAAIVLWASEALPVAITAIAVIVLQPLLGITNLNTAFQKSASPAFFFVFAMFCIAAAIVETGLDRRFAYWLLERAGTDSRRVLWALMLGTATLSTIISDVPACVIFMAIALGLLSRLGVPVGQSNFGKAAMVGIPIASMVGGIATPAGSSVNILGIHFIEEYSDITIPFVKWMAIGVPMVVVLAPLTAWAVVRCFPPEIDSIGSTDGIRSERAALGPMSSAARRTIGLVGVMMVLWILGSWVPQLNTVVVGLVGAVVLFLPGVGILDWASAEKRIGWATLLMIAGVTSVGAASVDTGLAQWMVESLLGGMTGWATVWVLLAISAFTVVIHLALPIGPVVNAVLIPPIVLLALGAGESAALYALPVAFTASCSFLLPLDAVSLLTYSKGYYRMIDMLGPGGIVSAAWVVWMTVLMLTVGPLLGFA